MPALRRALLGASRCLLLASPAAYVAPRAAAALLPTAHADAARGVRSSTAPRGEAAGSGAGAGDAGAGAGGLQWLVDRLLASNNQFAQGGITLMAVGAALAAAHSALLFT
jgi:hypothetical protein